MQGAAPGGQRRSCALCSSRCCGPIPLGLLLCSATCWRHHSTRCAECGAVSSPPPPRILTAAQRQGCSVKQFPGQKSGSSGCSGVTRCHTRTYAHPLVTQPAIGAQQIVARSSVPNEYPCTQQQRLQPREGRVMAPGHLCLWGRMLTGHCPLWAGWFQVSAAWSTVTTTDTQRPWHQLAAALLHRGTSHEQRARLIKE